MALWPNGQIPVCIDNGDYTANDPRFPAYLAATRAVLQREYETIAGANINFTGWQTCASPNDWANPGALRITYITANRSGSYRCFNPNASNPTAFGCQGYNQNLAMRIRFGTSTALGAGFDTLALHEAAHALGPFGDPNQSGATCNETGTQLTDPDSNSILNGTYCHSSGRLSKLDRVGFAFVYPEGGIPLSFRDSSALPFDGGQAIPGATLIAHNDYVERGILTNVLQGPDWDATCGNTRHFAAGVDLVISNLPEGTQCSVSHNFTDPWNRTREGTANVVVSSSKHAAVVMAVM